MKRACIIGIGNELRRDDGIGLEILKVLNVAGEDRAYDLIPLGQDVLELASIIEQYRKVIIIDALLPGEQMGEVVISGWEVRLGAVREYLSLHDIDVFDQIRLAKMRGMKADITFIGVVTADLGFGVGLSAELEIRLGDIVEGIRGWLSG